MRVGALDTIGMEGLCSTPNREFIPPSCNRRKKKLKREGGQKDTADETF
jgi:hypothetical protein